MPSVFLTKNSRKKLLEKSETIDSIEELANVLNWIENESKNPVKEELIIKVKPINASLLLLLTKTKEDRYIHTKIEKKSGGIREIKAPDHELKRVQRLLNCLLQTIFEPKAHYCNNGFMYGRDIIRNARPHLNKKFVLNCDIKDFFPSINYRRVRAVLRLSPFSFNNKNEDIAHLISLLCSYQGSLPQGAPTSPLLSNIVTQQLDRRLNKYCLIKKIKYSRYADDLTFSWNKEIPADTLISDITKIVNEEDFLINELKTRIKSRMDRQQVTGLVVNQKLNVKREYINATRAMLNNWEKRGLYSAIKKFKIHQPIHKVHYSFKDVVSGRIAFIGNVRGKEDPIYKRFKQKLETLKNCVDYSFISHEGVRNRLSVDNLKMENILLDDIHNTEDKFISFCTAAFHQIENLINYYYWKKFPNYNDFVNYLLLKNPKFRQRYKTAEQATQNLPNLKSQNINVLVYIFEEEFYFPKSGDKPFYDKRLTKLREIRNDDSHRCSVIEFDKEKVISDHNALVLKKKKYKQKHGKHSKYDEKEIEIEDKFALLIFLENKDYYFVRKIVTEAAKHIKKALKKPILAPQDL